MLDCAEYYINEEVGGMPGPPTYHNPSSRCPSHCTLPFTTSINLQGIGEAIARSKVPRKDLFLISKVWNTTVYKGEAAIRDAVQKSLKALRESLHDAHTDTQTREQSCSYI
jgi:aryl-alcohol dehydrogenase-like predicted oxidoreductase